MDDGVTVTLGPALTVAQRRGVDLRHELFHLPDRGLVVVAEQRLARVGWRCATVARRTADVRRHFHLPITVLEAAAREVTVPGGDTQGYVMAWVTSVWLRWPSGLPWRVAWVVAGALPPGELELELDTEQTRKMMMGLNLRRYAYTAVMKDLTDGGFLIGGVQVNIPG